MVHCSTKHKGHRAAGLASARPGLGLGPLGGLSLGELGLESCCLPGLAPAPLGAVMSL